MDNAPDSQERLLMEAYARLRALKTNIPTTGVTIKGVFVEEFHALIDLLEKNLRYGLGSFKVPDRAIVTDDPEFGGRWYDRAFVAAKVDGLLNYFEFQQSEPRPRIGFRPRTD